MMKTHTDVKTVTPVEFEKLPAKDRALILDRQRKEIERLEHEPGDDDIYFIEN